MSEGKRRKRRRVKKVVEFSVPIVKVRVRPTPQERCQGVSGLSASLGVPGTGPLLLEGVSGLSPYLGGTRDRTSPWRSRASPGSGGSPSVNEQKGEREESDDREDTSWSLTVRGREKEVRVEEWS